MHVHVAFTPAEEASAAIGVVVDVPRATSTIAQALASGFERVLCGAEIEDARDLRARIPDSWSAAREAVRIEGFDVGVSREFLQAEAETPILSTTNGTAAIFEAAVRDGVARLAVEPRGGRARAARRGEDVAILCAGHKGAFALDNAYCAGGSCRSSTHSRRTRRSQPSSSLECFPTRTPADRAPMGRPAWRRTFASAILTSS